MLDLSFVKSEFSLAEFVCDVTNVYQGLLLGHIVNIGPLVCHEHESKSWIGVLMEI